MEFTHTTINGQDVTVIYTGDFYYFVENKFYGFCAVAKCAQPNKITLEDGQQAWTREFWLYTLKKIEGTMFEDKLKRAAQIFIRKAENKYARTFCAFNTGKALNAEAYLAVKHIFCPACAQDFPDFLYSCQQP